MRTQDGTDQIIRDICPFSDNEQVKGLLKDLASEFGFPRTKRVLTLYFDNDVRLRCDENDVFLGQKIKAKSMETYREAKMKSKYIGLVIGMLSTMGLKKAAISNVIEMTFVDEENFKLVYLGDTLISKHQFEISLLGIAKYKSKVLDKILKNKLGYSDLVEKTANIATEQIIDEMGVLNDKIISFCKETNLSLGQTTNTSYYYQICSVSNDYSGLAEFFKLITGHEICDPNPSPVNFIQRLPSVSVIIPAYNLSESVLKTLKSLERQDHEINYEVIIVDDCSKKPITEQLIQVQGELLHRPIIIRKEKNTGSAQARNVGASVASNDILLFVDGDVVLTPNYLYEHLIRHKLFNKSVLVSFKENVNFDDPRISYEAIQQGVLLPNYQNDLRVTKYIDKDTMGYYPSNYMERGDIFSILSETNYFKTLSYGRRIGNYDLPSMVIGHNFSIPNSFFRAIGGFDNKLIGYGLEDTFLGMVAVAAGAFIVPVLACGVYHIDHPTRRGDLNKLRQEFRENSEIIENFLSTSE
ncbi:MAG: glycosyltransferase family 2 protein [Candidatus Shapirobacteria bacterium]|jgi:glycosyltransferase involved in cell wall biosynthesis